MNWDAIGAIAELLGATGVVVSLVYLAGQIRQNTNAQRRAHAREISTDLSATLRHVFGDPEMSSLVIRAFSDLSSLDPVERYRFDCFLYAWLAPFERALLDAQEGEYPAEFMAPISIGIAAFLRTEGGRAWWEERRSWFSLAGQRLIDAVLSDASIDDSGAGPVLNDRGDR